MEQGKSIGLYTVSSMILDAICDSCPKKDVCQGSLEHVILKPNLSLSVLECVQEFPWLLWEYTLCLYLP